VEKLEQVERQAQKLNEADATTSSAAAAKAATAATDNPGKYLVAGVAVNANGKYYSVLIDLSEFLRSCEFSNPQRDMLGKREAIKLNFRSRADAKFPIDMAFMSRVSGTVWIDAFDKVVVRLEGWPLQTTQPTTQPEVKPATETKTAHEAQDARQSEAAVIYQQVRLPTGVWVPSLIRMNAGGNTTLFNGLNWDVVFEFSDYKRFSTDVEGVKLEKPKKNP
jgi:outer membrane receptor protein involved in Fe transport